MSAPLFVPSITQGYTQPNQGCQTIAIAHPDPPSCCKEIKFHKWFTSFPTLRIFQRVMSRRWWRGRYIHVNVNGQGYIPVRRSHVMTACRRRCGIPPPTGQRPPPTGQRPTPTAQRLHGQYFHLVPRYCPLSIHPSHERSQRTPSPPRPSTACASTFYDDLLDDDDGGGGPVAIGSFSGGGGADDSADKTVGSSLTAPAVASVSIASPSVKPPSPSAAAAASSRSAFIRSSARNTFD
jgi:hypothetical protein